MTKKRKTKTMRLLMKEKKELKGNMRKEGNNATKMEKLQTLKKRILDEDAENYYRRLQKTCNDITKDGKFNSGKFWEVKKKMDRKKEDKPHAVRNNKGELVTENGEILNAYKDYFEDLLTITNKKTKLEENKETVEKVEKEFNEIVERGRMQEPIKTSTELVEAVVKGLKKKKARDIYGWNNEMLKDGGIEMIESLRKMADAVQMKCETPNPWNYMIIKCTHKRGLMEELPNKRGLFLTNIVGKAYENITDRSSNVKFDKSQNGGTKGKGGVDNWMMLMAIVDEGKRLKKPVYLFFADLVKCFDRLWLKDCLNDLHSCGMREREVLLLYKMNESAVFRVSTPVGLTEEVEVREVVKQGTVYGPKLCCASTGKVNKNLEVEEVVYPTVSVKALTYVDDINSNGRKQVVEAVMERCGELEKEKLWEFSTEKSNWMCQRNRKRNVEDIEVEVAQGKIKKVRVYKYLGNMINEEGNMDDQLEFMEGKIGGIVSEANRMCCQSKIGKYEIEGKRLVYEQLGVPSVYYNIEVWTNFRQSDKDKLESIQGRLLKGLYGLPKTTPYWGLLYELDIVPILYVITYKRMMLYHNIVNSDDSREIQHLVKAQEISGYDECWFGNLRKEGLEIDMIIDEGKVKGKQKSKWKEEVKSKINEAVAKRMRDKKKTSKKMRFLNTSGCNTYLTEVYNDDARLALKIRLNMVDWIQGNFGGKGNCPMCGGEDTTEHVFECNNERLDVVNIKNLEDGKEMMEIVRHFRETEKKRKELVTSEIEIRMNVLQTEGTL